MPNQKDPSKSYCGMCGKERAPIKMCGCAGAGSGTSRRKIDSETKSKNNLNSSNQITSSSQVIDASIQTPDKTTWVQSLLCSDKIVNYTAGALLVESDRLNGNLIFKIQPGLSKEDMHTLQAFLKTVYAEFEKFIEELIDRRVSTKDFNAVLKDDELAIHIPVPVHYDAFVKRLGNKNLLPVPNPEREEKKEMLSSVREDKKQVFNPTPLSTRLEKK